jgi:hypothetical protein
MEARPFVSILPAVVVFSETLCLGQLHAGVQINEKRIGSPLRSEHCMAG